jgi:GntR family transcriptional regulator, transcriptional repressor for pyruvate dehydrogenase complex
MISSLKSIDNTPLADKAEMNLVNYFIENKLKPGDSVPTEMELSEALNVSRTVIREALIRLRMIGLIESKRHKGTVITNPDLLALFRKSLNPYILDDSTLKDIFELRLVLEIGMGDLIFERITENDIKELRDIVKHAPKKSDKIFSNIEHEIRFHGKLYEITGNETLKKFQTMLLPIFKHVYDSGILERQVEKRKYVTHKELVDVIEKRDLNEFRVAMRGHLDSHFQRLCISHKKPDRKK